MDDLVFKERPGSGNTTAEPPTLERLYLCAGLANPLDVQAAAIQLTPQIENTYLGLLYRQDVRVEKVGFKVFNVTVPYAAKKKDEGEWTWNFDTTGGTIHIKAGKSHVDSFGDDPADHGGMIGVHGSGNKLEVDGTDIVIPALKFNVEYKHPQGVVTIPFAKQLARYTGKCNSGTFLTCDAGEVLYLGSTGSDGTDAVAQVGYQFAMSENLHDQVLDAISGIEKDGWDIAWIEYEPDVDDSKPTVKPIAVHVERVYDRIDLASALGFGG